jgi:DNA-binding protein H-NS
MATYKQLTAQLEKLHDEVAAAREKEMADVIAYIKRKIIDYDLTIEELGFDSRHGGMPFQKSLLSAKYRNPETGETWSGRGRPPAWLAGRNKARFLIGKKCIEALACSRPRSALS